MPIPSHALELNRHHGALHPSLRRQMSQDEFKAYLVGYKTDLPGYMKDIHAYSQRGAAYVSDPSGKMYRYK